MSNSKSMFDSRMLLLASVSSGALAISTPALVAADLSVPPNAPASRSTWWIEGGSQTIIGADSFIPGLSSPFSTPAKTLGFGVAGGFDYRLDPFWHVSGDFRYGRNRSRTSNSSPQADFNIPTTTCSPVCGTRKVPFTGTNSARRSESNWEADFMVGRDIGLGIGSSQLKLGIRVAEIRGQTTGAARWTVPTATNSSAVFDTRNQIYQQTSRFVGGSPRLALEGMAMLGGPWFVEYMGGVAGLYGTDGVSQTVATFDSRSASPVCASGCVTAGFSSTEGVVFNTDAMLGIGYMITPYARLSANYRVDAYFNALREFDANGNPFNANRIYHGPSLRLTVAF